MHAFMCSTSALSWGPASREQGMRRGERGGCRCGVKSGAWARLEQGRGVDAQ